MSQPPDRPLHPPCPPCPPCHADPRPAPAVAEALWSAIERGELSAAYQPIVDMDSGAVRCVEALARWHHPALGTVPPCEFVPVAEASGLIVPLGRWMLETAVRDAATWLDDRVAISVNVSAHQLQHPSFVPDVARALRSSGLAPERLVLELTESAVVRHPAAVRAQLEALKSRGVRLSLDDFGAGYSSLHSLRHLPFDVLKIDRGFVAPLGEGDGDATCAAIVAAIVSFGVALSLETVAEGIESPEQRDALVRLGCRLGQGFLFGRPVGAAAIAARCRG